MTTSSLPSVYACLPTSAQHKLTHAQKDALARDLNLYFPGLASVLSFASLSVRPLYLSVFEKHILKLDGAALRPALKAMRGCDIV